MSRVTFPAHFHVATNPATGEEFILPDDRDLDERRAIRLADMEQAIASQPVPGGEAEAQQHQKDMAAFRAQMTAQIEAETSRQRAERDASLPHAHRHTYTLRKPTSGEHFAAMAKAQVVGASGLPYFSEDAYVREVLPVSVEGLKPQEVLALDPAIFNELRFRLLRSISPPANRMAFMGGGSGATGKAQPKGPSAPEGEAGTDSSKAV